MPDNKASENEKVSFYNKVNLKHLRESIEQIKQGKTVVKTMEELEQMENE